MPKEVIRLEIEDKVLQKIIKNVVKEDVDVFEIRDGVEYGIYQELGFNHWKSGEWIQNPFLVPAFEQETRGIEMAIGKAIELGQSLNDLLFIVAQNIKAVAVTLAPRNAESAKSPATKKQKVTGALKDSLTVDRK